MGLKYDFLEWYGGYNGNDNIDDISFHTKRKLQNGFFYSIIQTSTTKEPYNCRPICISLGESTVDNGKYVVVDLCRLSKDARIKLIELFFKAYNDQISKNIEQFYDPKCSDEQKPISKFGLAEMKHLLRVFKIGHSIIKLNPNEFKEVRLIPFSQVYKIIDMCDENHFINININTVRKLTHHKSK